MKLKQIVCLTESVDLATVQEWFIKKYPGGTKPTVTMSTDEPNSIVVDGNFYNAAYPDNFPPMHTITGVLATSHERPTSMSKFVGKGFEFSGTIIGPKDSRASLPTYKLTDFPRLLPTGKGTGFFRIQNQGQLIIDDPSVLDGYGTRSIPFDVIQGVNLLPTNRKYDQLSIRDDIHNIPAGLKTRWLRIGASDGQSFKGFHKQKLQVTTETLVVKYDTPGPMMWLIIGEFTAKEIHVLGPNQKFDSNFIMHLRAEYQSGNLDKFEIQEQLIDAGYKEYAKL